jgi:hypothetical protein
MQLSAKGLLKPFSNSLKDDNTTERGNNDEDAGGDVEPIDKGGDEDNDDDAASEGEGEDEPDDGEDEDDPFYMLGEADHEQLLEDMAAVCTTLNKVCIVIHCSNC